MGETAPGMAPPGDVLGSVDREHGDGVKHVLGICASPTEGAKFSACVCSELTTRGVKDLLIV